MTNRFEQSAPPSIDKLYRTLPIGPFGVSPYLHARHDRRADGEIGITRLARRLASFARTARSTLQRWVFGERAYAHVALAERSAACPPCP